MLLGLMSLLLSATEEYLLKICVKDNHYKPKSYESTSSSYYPPTDGDSPGYYAPPGYGQDEQADDHYYPPPSHRTLLMDGLDLGADGLRRLSTFSSAAPSTPRVLKTSIGTCWCILREFARGSNTRLRRNQRP